MVGAVAPRYTPPSDPLTGRHIPRARSASCWPSARRASSSPDPPRSRRRRRLAPASASNGTTPRSAAPPPGHRGTAGRRPPAGMDARSTRSSPMCAAQAAAADEIVSIRTWIRAPRRHHGRRRQRPARLDRRPDRRAERIVQRRDRRERLGFRFALRRDADHERGLVRHAQPGPGPEDEARAEARRAARPEHLHRGHRTLLGYAYLAQDAAQVGELDGVVVDYRTLPGGGLDIYSEGDTACTRSATGSTCSTRSTAAATAGTRSRTPRRRPLPRSTARSDRTRARATTGTTR